MLSCIRDICNSYLEYEGISTMGWGWVGGDLYAPADIGRDGGWSARMVDITARRFSKHPAIALFGLEINSR